MRLSFQQATLSEILREYRRRYEGISSGYYVQTIQALLRAGDKSTINICHLDLTSIDLSNLDLTGYQFYKCNLMDTNFSGANLSNANFLYCNLAIANFNNIITNANTRFLECHLSNTLINKKLIGKNNSKRLFEKVMKNIICSL